MSSKRKKTINVVFGDGKLTISGLATLDIKESIKEIAKSMDLKYKFDEDIDAWVIEGDRDKLVEYINELRKEAQGFGIDVVVEMRDEPKVKPQVIYEEKEDILEKVASIGFDVNTVGVLFGTALVGKTRFAIKLAEALKERMGLTPKFLVTETNWLFKVKDKPFIEMVREKFGSDSVMYCRTTRELLTSLKKSIESNAFVVVDSIGAISQRFLTRFIIERGEEETIVVAPRVIPFVNAITQYIAESCLEKGATALLIAHEQQLINRKFFTEDTKPSFGSRALHSCTYIWKMYIDPKTNERKIKCVVHRFDQSYIGKEIVIKLL